MKIQKRNDKGRGKKKHQTKKAPLIRLTCQHQIHVGSEQYRKKKKKGAKQKNTKTAAFTAALLSPRRGEVPPVHVQCSFSLAMALSSGVQTINCTWQEVKLYIYIYKKTKNIKQCENSDHFKINKKKREHLNHHIIIILLSYRKCY